METLATATNKKDNINRI